MYIWMETKEGSLLNQAMSISYGALGSEKVTFDMNSSMAVSSVTDLSGNTTSFGYADPLGKPSSQTNAMGKTKSFTYAPITNIMQSVIDEEGRKTVYDVDRLGRRTKETISDSAGTPVQITNFEYGNSKFPGCLTQKSVQKLGSGDPSWVQPLVTQFVLDGNGRVAQQIVDPNGVNAVTSNTYDKNGNKTSATDPRGNTTWFSYDARNRLITVTYADGTQKQTSYDAAGNKTEEIDENGFSTTFAYDALNRLVTQTRKMNGSGPDLVTTFSYNNANRKISVTDPNGNVTTMAYDNLQRNTAITDALGNTTTYI